jgi:hypothetical protein
VCYAPSAHARDQLCESYDHARRACLDVGAADTLLELAALDGDAGARAAAVAAIGGLMRGDDPDAPGDEDDEARTAGEHDGGSGALGGGGAAATSACVRARARCGRQRLNNARCFA